MFDLDSSVVLGDTLILVPAWFLVTQFLVKRSNFARNRSCKKCGVGKDDAKKLFNSIVYQANRSPGGENAYAFGEKIQNNLFFTQII